MRIIDEIPDAHQIAHRTEFLAVAQKDPELRNECAYVAFLSAWEH